MKYSIKDTKISGNPKDLTALITTGEESPEEVLRTLDKFGIEWEVTEGGALWIRCWQVGAEDFVFPEEAAIIRSGRSSSGQGDELDWVSRNLQDLREPYGGQWVAIYNNEVAAAAPSLPDLMSQITEVNEPFVTFIPADSIIWTFTYAN